MSFVPWTFSRIPAAIFLSAGSSETHSTHDRTGGIRAAPGRELLVGALKRIGAAEVLGAVRLILPALVGWAAAGLALIMVGAMIHHTRRPELRNLIVSTVLAVFAVIAVGRFGLTACAIPTDSLLARGPQIVASNS